MKSTCRRMKWAAPIAVFLLATLGSPAAADGAAPRGPGVSPAEVSAWIDGSVDVVSAASGSPSNVSAALSASCTSCYTCGANLGICVALCGQAAVTKNPSHMRDCGICLMTAVGAGACIPSCWSCLTNDYRVACLDYPYATSMCTSEEWVCCNGQDGCISCAPYGGYCPSHTYHCGYGSEPGCGEDDTTLFVVRRPGIRVADMLELDSSHMEVTASGAAGSEVERARPGRDLTPPVGLPRAVAGSPAGDRVPDRKPIRLRWHQRGPDAVFAFQCDGGGGGGNDGGGGGTYCTDCSCTGQYTSWEGTVCGGSSAELVDQCWSSCY